ncbi:thiol-disulfide oxidoreductase DCC family protein [Shinella oryzae]|uniref:thiol-disulfide oxidoreductase DCC family protein n=1 Tax=Shinella oryzae TaxID=2871820 RepID=UPI001FF1EC7A|nr:DUF393 domain-containing protein [Shinella oryzae]UPA25211.1 DUF393 domain-containing protein [Shinella oryzae]
MNSNFDLGAHPEWEGKSVVIYDGECPFCSNYVKFQRLRETLGNVLLLDARAVPGLVREFEAAGKPLDDGMVLIMGGRIYYGADCVNRLALLSSRRGWFNKLNALIFSSPTVANVLYPFMKFGRAMVLRVLGRKKLTAAEGVSGDSKHTA